MVKSLFTAPLREVAFEDVLAFCRQGLPESINLDYKREPTAPGKLAKTISSFANTFGGLILIGVNEDSASRPAPPFDGLQYKPKLEETVWSVVVEQIYPPVFPEVHVCPPEGDRTFMIIRVPQSTITPHAVRHNTAVYLRTGNISKPELLERLATMDEIPWLRERRRRSEELKAQILTRFEERIQTLQRLKGLESLKAKVHVSFGPKFPTIPLLTFDELAELRQTLKLFADRVSDAIPAHEGLIRAYVSKDDVDSVTETNVFGFTFLASQLHALANTDLKIVFLSLLIDAIADATRFGQRFLAKLGYWGVCELNVSIRDVAGKTLRPFGDRFFVYPKTQLDNKIDLTRDLPSSVWTDDEGLAGVIVEVARAVSWSFGWTISEVEIRTYLDKSEAWQASG